MSDTLPDGFVNRMLIREQIDNCIDALNHRDWDRLGETLCDDAHWSSGAPFNLSFAPKAAFMKMLHEVQAYQFGFVFQMGHGITVRELTGDSAKVVHTLEIFGNSFHTIGLYYDRMRKEADGVWRFLRRHFLPTWHENREVSGETYRTLPAPFPDL